MSRNWTVSLVPYPFSSRLSEVTPEEMAGIKTFETLPFAYPASLTIGKK
jgi:hypothetical protein